MIAFVKGVLEQVQGQVCVIDVRGVGYTVHISPATAARLPARGQEVKLHTFMQVKEDGVSLHGFLTPEEVRFFTMLLSVTGVGAKVASAVLSALSPDQLVLAIMADDVATLSRTPGVGRKIAQRLALELRDKMKAYAEWTPAASAAGAEADPALSDTRRDARDALSALGYSSSEGLKAVMEVAEDGMTVETVIRLALKRLKIQ